MKDMRDNDRLLSVHLAGEKGEQKGTNTVESSVWKGLIQYNDRPFLATLTSFAKETFLTTGARLSLSLEPISDHEPNLGAIHLNAVETPAQVTYTITETKKDPTLEAPSAYHPVTWHLKEARKTLGPILVGDIERVALPGSQDERDSLVEFWALSQAIIVAE